MFNRFCLHFCINQRICLHGDVDLGLSNDVPIYSSIFPFCKENCYLCSFLGVKNDPKRGLDYVIKWVIVVYLY